MLPRASAQLTPYLRDCADDLVDAQLRIDVHDLRVACRRIRSVLRSGRSLVPQADGRASSLIERCRLLGSGLSGARDDQVAVELLTAWADDDGWAPDELALLLEALGLPVDGAGTEREDAVPPARLADALELAAEVRAFATALETTDATGDGGLDERVEAERNRVLRRARSRFHDHRLARGPEGGQAAAVHR